MTTNGLAINQEVYIARSGSGRYGNSYTKGRIVKVTPSGRVNVQVAESIEPKQFGAAPSYEEIGAQKYHRSWLRFDIEAVDAELAQRQAQRDTNRKVEELTKCLADHRTGFNDYHITAEVKAELTALIASM